MFIILRQDTWSQYEIVSNHLGRPKQFTCESEALDFAKEMELGVFQLIEVLIQEATMKISRYILFAVKYCEKKGYQHNESGEYSAEDLWEGILALHEYENKNR